VRLQTEATLFSLRPLGPMSGQFGPGWTCLRPILGLCWPYVSPSLAYVGPVLALCWPYVGPMLAHLVAYVEAMLAICETIPVERPPRCPLFLPGPLCGTKNHVKTTVFYFRQQKIVLVQARKTPFKKKDVFVTSHTRNTVNYGDFGRRPT